MKPRIADALIALSLANLCMVASWSQVLSLSTPRAYLLDISDISVVAVMLDVLVLGAVFLAAAAWLPRPAAEWALLAVLLLPLNQIRIGFNLLNTPDVAFWTRDSGLPLLVLGWLVALLIAWLVFRSRRKLVHGARQVLLVLAPFVLITFGRGVAALARAPDWQPPSPDTSVPRAARDTPRHRVLLVVFDELDSRMAFTERPADLALPAFDRLRAQGLELTRATSAGIHTQLTLPIFFTGAQISHSKPLSSGELGVRLPGDSALQPFRSLPNLFSIASQTGLKTGIAGWYHPYCRLLADVVTRCYWQPIYREFERAHERDNLLFSMRDYLLALSPWREKVAHIQTINGVVDHALSMAADTSLDFAVLHLPVPHLPPVYDRHARRFTLHRYKVGGYIDNLALADRVLERLDSALARSPGGAGSRTTLVITSDHPWRNARWYDGRTAPGVPLIVRMPPPVESRAAPRPITDSSDISTAVVFDLVLSLLRGEHRSVADVQHWLNGRATPHIVRSPRR